MGYPVVDEKGDSRVREQIERLLRGGVRSHDDNRVGGMGRGRQVGIIHQGDVREEGVTGRKVKESGVVEARDDLLGERRGGDRRGG